jgi:hypothetical protein
VLLLQTDNELLQEILLHVVEVYASIHISLKLCLQLQQGGVAAFGGGAAAAVATAAAAARSEGGYRHISTVIRCSSSGGSCVANCSCGGSGRSDNTAGNGCRISVGSNSSSSGKDINSSSSSQTVQWQHLLRLHESRKLAAAMAAFDSCWALVQLPPETHCEGAHNSSSSSSARACRLMLVNAKLVQAVKDMIVNKPAQELDPEHVLPTGSGRELLLEPYPHNNNHSLYAIPYPHVIRLCRTISAVAPLPVVCNNPGCRQTDGMSEAAAARYVCAGCGCRYCSAACQAGGWRSHKKACRRMAACGLRVESR